LRRNAAPTSNIAFWSLNMTSRRFPLAFAVVALTAACNSDSAMGPARQDEIIGTWISTGSDVAVGLTSTMRAAAVRATFKQDFTYTIELVDSTHATLTYAGTWSVSGAEETIRTIALAQTSPTTGSGQGVFQVSGARMTFEVGPMTQQGFGSSNVAGGFGSSASPDGVASSVWIQRFWNAETDLVSPACNPDSSSVLGKRPCDREDWLSAGKR
jgi:hypothetical protein